MKQVSIGHTLVGDGNPCLIAFEPSATYTTVSEAKALLDAVAAAGADAVKFQTFLPGEAERMMGGRRDIEVEFGTPTGRKKESVQEALKRRELHFEEWKALASFAHENGLLFIASAYFFDTVARMRDLGVDALKVSKGDVNNALLIEAMAKTGLPVILDGREKFEDVRRGVEICKKAGNEEVIIMHCPAGYPALDDTVHLRAIPAIKEMTGFPVGFADHSLGDLMNYAAVALGANMLEKTLSPDRATERVEHFMSLEPHELKQFVDNVRRVEKAMGSADILSSSRVEENARRSFVANRNIAQGENITLEMLDFRRPGNAGISVAQGHEVLGKKAAQDIPAGTFLQWEMLE
ncbi:MAG: N-acetylneuraminate synthase family protein [Parcubacteria group bacterium]|nr:N-acetylneuraminate synthase family protein [Parcubacteria group bacterium]